MRLAQASVPVLLYRNDLSRMTQRFIKSYCHLLMRQIFFAILLLFSVSSSGQKRDKWQLSFLIQPELTFHKNQYSFRWKERFTKQTFNVGLASSVQYNLNERIFIEGGLAFISRKLTTNAFVDQSLLPPPYYDSTNILYVTRSVALRTLQLPLSIGATVVKTTKAKIFVKGTYTPNFLLNAKYEVNNYPAFKKNYWQGYSLNGAVGADYRLNNKMSLTGCLGYSLTNTVNKDPYVFSQDERTIALPHSYLQLSTGIKIDLNQR